MTYCLAIRLDAGLVFISDSRTNAGIDNVSTYSKMYGYGVPGERQFTILTSGNLATSQAVVTQIKRDIREKAKTNLLNLDRMGDIAEYIGELSRREQQKSAEGGINVEANFIFGGQLPGRSPSVYLIYPQGNYITTSQDTVYLQIGEGKYGKPVLDRILTPSSSLETAAMCALVSMDSTIRSNLSVGPPVELSIYPRDSFEPGRYYRFDEDSEYLRQLKNNWNRLLLEAFKKLPPIAWSNTWDGQNNEDMSDYSS